MAKIWNTSTGESQDLSPTQAENVVRTSRGAWSFAKPLPPGYDAVIPRYRASTDLKPSAYARHRTEPPFASMSDNSVWQYGERPVAAGEIVETTLWPAASMVPLNDSAKLVREFFTSHQKSRLPFSPWRNGRLHLDDGLTGTIPDAGVLRPALPQAAPQPVRVAR
jgi:hypothetical protein